MLGRLERETERKARGSNTVSILTCERFFFRFSKTPEIKDSIDLDQLCLSKEKFIDM